MTRYSKCKACGKRILWALTPGGSRVPLDADESVLIDPTKQVFVVADFGDETVVTAIPPTSRLFVSHFATCPNPERFSKK